MGDISSEATDAAEWYNVPSNNVFLDMLTEFCPAESPYFVET